MAQSTSSLVAFLAHVCPNPQLSQLRGGGRTWEMIRITQRLKRHGGPALGKGFWKRRPAKTRQCGWSSPSTAPGPHAVPRVPPAEPVGQSALAPAAVTASDSGMSPCTALPAPLSEWLALCRLPAPHPESQLTKNLGKVSTSPELGKVSNNPELGKVSTNPPRTWNSVN